MSANSFFENPILNSPYEYPRWHWKMDAGNKPTGDESLLENCREAYAAKIDELEGA